MGIPTLSPQLFIEQRFGEFPFHWCLLKINIYDKYIIISRKLQPIIPCIEECLPTPLSDRLLASRLSPSSLVGGTLRGLAPEGRIYQSEQFYISANTTEEDCTDLTSYGMGIKIPCKSHWWRAGLYAGYRTTLFQKVFIRHPFILPSPYALPVTIAPQKYNEFPKHARNVNLVLTIEKRQNLRKKKKKKNIRLCNVLINNILYDNNILNKPQTEIFASFSGLPP